MRLLKLVPDNTNIRFLRLRNVAVTISSLLLIGSVFLLVTKGLNFGIDFTGGQMLRVTFSQPADLEDIRSRVSALGYGDATIQEFGSPNEVSIRMALPSGGEDAANAAAASVRDTLTDAYPDARFDAVETVSGNVSQELVEKGVLALLFAMIAISFYIWFRFEWQFGIASLFALFHDVTLTLGFFALTQMEFDLNVIAALLTLIGYSLNDNIVIFDRIRENLRKYRKMEIEPLLDLSINETLSRTVATNVSMFIALSALLFLGPDVIYSFTVALFISIIVGTFSTMYISAPFLIWLKVDSNSFVPKESPGGGERVTYNEGG